MTEALIRFMQGLPQCVPPQRSDGTLDGAAPFRGAVFCQPFIMANSFGWTVGLPFDIDLCLRGQSVYWREDVRSEWQPLIAKANVRDFAFLSDHAPESAAKYCSIPLCAVGPEANIVQFWTGLLVKTQPGLCTLVRPLVNRRNDAAFDVIEGIIDTDWWLGPLIFPIRINREDEVIAFRRTMRVIQLQLVARQCISDDVYENASCLVEPSGWHLSDWEKFQSSMELREPEAKRGSYRALSRQHQRDHNNE